MTVVIAAILVLIWLVGGVRLWRLQSASRATTGLDAAERLWAICWLPIAVYYLLISTPAFLAQCLSHQRR